MKNKIINEYKYPYDKTKVTKAYRVNRRVYISLYILASVMIVFGILVPILNGYMLNVWWNQTCSIITNLGYGLFGSTFVSMLIEIQTVKSKNESHSEMYRLLLRQFLIAYITLMRTLRDVVLYSEKDDSPERMKEISWNEWYERLKQELLPQLEKYRQPSQHSDQHYIDAIIQKVRPQVQNTITCCSKLTGFDLILTEGVDEVSFKRLNSIQMGLQDVDLNFESIRSLKLLGMYLETLYRYVGGYCDSWFLLKDLDKKIVKTDLDAVVNLTDKTLSAIRP